jgi:hypothetical protein
MCSQCRGAKPNVVTRDPDSGQLYVNGKLLETRSFVMPAQTPRNTKRGRKPKAKQPAVIDDSDPDE